MFKYDVPVIKEEWCGEDVECLRTRRLGGIYGGGDFILLANLVDGHFYPPSGLPPEGP